MRIIKMDNEKFNQNLNIKSLGNYVINEVRTDYIRIIEFCDRNIKGLKSQLKLIPLNPPDCMNDDEIKEELLRIEGELRAYDRLKYYIESRLWVFENENN